VKKSRTELLAEAICLLTSATVMLEQNGVLDTPYQLAVAAHDARLAEAAINELFDRVAETEPLKDLLRCHLPGCIPHYKCRDCGRRCCEHRCSFKTADAWATCSSCLLRKEVTK